ncbi:MAG: hypothetical protein EBR82_39315 [Caulobacteraceae bacterium]|nr:hypothetical protein [Caulobacteraceae bacterium]
MSNKWQIGPVKLANGDDAFIDAINEEQEHYRYTGRVMGQEGFVPVGWHSDGRLMWATTDHPGNLAPPPKKKLRVKCWLVVYQNGNTCRYIVEADALVEANRLGFALIEINREVEEGEGL